MSGTQPTPAPQQPSFLPDAAAQPAALDAWVAEVEAAHAAEGVGLPPPEAPDLERLMAAWTPAEEQQLRTSSLPDPHQVFDGFNPCHREGTAPTSDCSCWMLADTAPMQSLPHVCSKLQFMLVICTSALQDIDTATYARLCCNVIGQRCGGGTAGAIQALHGMFALYMEFKTNPSFHGRGLFEADAMATL